jgi:hypothetical protein
VRGENLQRPGRLVAERLLRRRPDHEHRAHVPDDLGRGRQRPLDFRIAVDPRLFALDDDRLPPLVGRTGRFARAFARRQLRVHAVEDAQLPVSDLDERRVRELEQQLHRLERQRNHLLCRPRPIECVSVLVEIRDLPREVRFLLETHSSQISY